MVSLICGWWVFTRWCCLGWSDDVICNITISAGHPTLYSEGNFGLLVCGYTLRWLLKLHMIFETSRIFGLWLIRFPLYVFSQFLCNFIFAASIIWIEYNFEKMQYRLACCNVIFHSIVDSSWASSQSHATWLKRLA